MKDPRKLPGEVRRLGDGLARSGEEALRAAGRRVDAALRSSEAAQVVSTVDEQVSAFRRSRKLGRDSFRGLHVTVHRGYVVGGEARVHVRVTEAPLLAADAAGLPYVDVLWLNLRKYAAMALPGVELTVAVAEGQEVTTSGRHGNAAVAVAVPEDLPPGWHEVTVTAAPEGQNVDPVVASGRVFKPDPAADLALVSDIDDTIIRTGLSDRLTALRRALFRDAHSRQAVPGMASLYRGLVHRVDADGRLLPQRPCFYVSTGSWAFYEMLVQFQQLRAFPRGPIFLTDWGPTEKYITRSGVQHKRASLCRLLEAYPHLRFLLVGDSGEADPQIYAELARQHPGRVAGIVIILVDEDDEKVRAELDDLRDELAGLGVPLHCAPAAVAVAEELHAAGLCDDETVEGVRLEVSARV